MQQAYTYKMYCPETIKRLNAQATVRKDEEVNSSLLKIKEALCRVDEIDSQIEAIRLLRQIKPGQARQLELAEQFYLQQRKNVLELQDTALHLGEVQAACKFLLEHDEESKLTLQGRLAAADFSGNGRIAGEVAPEFDQAQEKRERLEMILAAIQETLDEYSREYSTQFSRR